MEVIFSTLEEMFDGLKIDVLGAIVTVLPWALLIFGAFIAIKEIIWVVESVVYGVQHRNDVHPIAPLYEPGNKMGL